MPFISGNVPQNQIDALPIITPDAAAAAGDLQIVGGSISRFWSPATLGLNGVAATASGGVFFLATPYLDVSGCTRFAMFISRFNAVGDAIALTSTTVLAQYRLLKTSTPALTPVDQSVNSYVSLISSNIGFPAILAGATQNAVPTWSPEAPTGSSANARPMVVGTDVRVVVHLSGAHLPGAADIWTVWLQGQS